MKRDRKTPLREIVAANIRAARKARGLSQEALAHEADLHRVNVSKIERGMHSLSLDNLYWIAQVLKVTPASLLIPPDAASTNDDPA